MILKTCYAYIKVSQELFLHSTLRDYVIISSTKQNTTKKSVNNIYIYIRYEVKEKNISSLAKA